MKYFERNMMKTVEMLCVFPWISSQNTKAKIALLGYCLQPVMFSRKSNRGCLCEYPPFQENEIPKYGFEHCLKRKRNRGLVRQIARFCFIAQPRSLCFALATRDIVVQGVNVTRGECPVPCIGKLVDVTDQCTNLQKFFIPGDQGVRTVLIWCASRVRAPSPTHHDQQYIENGDAHPGEERSTGNLASGTLAVVYNSTVNALGPLGGREGGITRH